jgi:hypothetical protein
MHRHDKGGTVKNVSLIMIAAMLLGAILAILS